MKKTLYLIRGLAGSGKTTLARTILDSYMSWDEDVDGLMVCADDFFEVDGEYRFDASRLSQAHEWCRGRVEDNMLDGEHIIVVHNTFSRRWEMEPYFKLAKLFRYSVFVIECQNDFGSVHDVPDEVRERMASRWESNPRNPEGING